MSSLIDIDPIIGTIHTTEIKIQPATPEVKQIVDMTWPNETKVRISKVGTDKELDTTQPIKEES